MGEARNNAASREKWEPGVVMAEGRPYMIRSDGHVHHLRVGPRIVDPVQRARVQEVARRFGLSKSVIVRPTGPEIIQSSTSKRG